MRRKLLATGKLIKFYASENKDLVLHPGAAVIVPILPDGRILMVKQRRFAIQKWSWEVPAGTLEDKEKPLNCAKRELEEETGYKAGKIRKILDFYSSPGFLHERMHIYLATSLHKGAQNLDEDEEIRVYPLKMSEILGLIRKNRVYDAKTIAAILFYREFLENRKHL
ncbi:MAG: NUDIX hydrolase [Candidatus Firestonebacteria bacterium]